MQSKIVGVLVGVLLGVCGLLGTHGPVRLQAANQQPEAAPGLEPTSDAPSTGHRQEMTAADPVQLGLETEAERLRSLSGFGLMEAMRKLRDAGDDDALGLIIEAIRADPDAIGSSERVWELLRDIDDPRIFELARELLERSVAEDLVGRGKTQGYLHLVASHGGGVGANLILDFVINGERKLAAEAARSMQVLADHSHVEEYIRLLEESREARAIGKALATWNDPAVNDRLRHTLAEGNLKDHLRHVIAETLGRGADSEFQVQEVITAYWEAREDWSVEDAFYGVRGLWGNYKVGGEAVRQDVHQVLSDALTSASWPHAVAFILTYDEWRTPSTRAALEQLLSQLSDQRDLDRVNEAIAAFY